MGYIKLGKTAVLVNFMLIYAMGGCPQAQRTILCIYYENCIYINVIVLYFVFPSVFIGEGQYLTNYFNFGFMYISLFNFILNY